MPKVITPEEGAELRQLYADLPEANKRVAEALRTNGQPLEGEALRRLMVEDEKASAIVRRIKELQGITGQHWMA